MHICMCMFSGRCVWCLCTTCYVCMLSITINAASIIVTSSVINIISSITSVYSSVIRMFINSRVLYCVLFIM